MNSCSDDVAVASSVTGSAEQSATSWSLSLRADKHPARERHRFIPSPEEEPVARRREKNAYGQYFTPRHIADLMVGLAQCQTSERVLDPCSGQGVFLDALLDRGFKRIEAVEIDPALAQHPSVSVSCGSFLSYAPPHRYRLIIGNPPYIRWKDLPPEGRSEMQAHPLYGELFNSLSDYLTAFIAGSIRLLEQGGELIFITPSFWMHTLHAAPLRDWILRHGRITDVIDFGEAEVFPGVSSAIIIFRFEKVLEDRTLTHHRYLGPRRIPTSRLALDDSDNFAAHTIRPFQQASHWTLATEEELVEVEALEAACVQRVEDLYSTPRVARLGDYVQIANGMVSGLDRAFRLPREVVQQLSREELRATLRVTKARQLQTFVTNEDMLYADVPLGISENEALKNYPVLMRHLAQFRSDLEKRYSYGRDLPYWEWAFRRSESFHRNGLPKGFVPCKERITSRDRVRFSLVPDGAVAVQDVTAFAPSLGTRESIEYIVAYLCHPFVTTWVLRRGLIKGGVAEFSEKPLSDIPFRAIRWDDTEDVAAHDEILRLMSLARHGSQANRLDTQQRLEGIIGNLLRRQ